MWEYSLLPRSNFPIAMNPIAGGMTSSPAIRKQPQLASRSPPWPLCSQHTEATSQLTYKDQFFIDVRRDKQPKISKTMYFQPNFSDSNNSNQLQSLILARWSALRLPQKAVELTCVQHLSGPVSLVLPWMKTCDFHIDLFDRNISSACWNMSLIPKKYSEFTLEVLQGKVGLFLNKERKITAIRLNKGLTQTQAHNLCVCLCFLRSNYNVCWKASALW